MRKLRGLEEVLFCLTKIQAKIRHMPRLNQTATTLEPGLWFGLTYWIGYVYGIQRVCDRIANGMQTHAHARICLTHVLHMIAHMGKTMTRINELIYRLQILFYEKRKNRGKAKRNAKQNNGNPPRAAKNVHGRATR